MSKVEGALERETVKTHDEFLLSHGWRKYRLHAGTLRRRGAFIRTNKKGTPDGIFVRRFQGIDQVLFIEGKRESGGVVSADQQDEIRELRGAGFRVAVSNQLDNDFIQWYASEFNRPL